MQVSPKRFLAEYGDSLLKHPFFKIKSKDLEPDAQYTIPAYWDTLRYIFKSFNSLANEKRFEEDDCEEDESEESQICTRNGNRFTSLFTKGYSSTW